MSEAKGVGMLTTKTALRVVNIEDIGFDPSYQRDVVRSHRKIVSEFDENALGVPLVGQRSDGTLWCVDGRQRLTALGKLGKKTVRAEVFVSSGPEHEANVFKLVNGGRTKLQPGELFRAKLTAGDQEAWAIKSAVEAAGFKLLITRGRTGGGHGETAWREVRAVTTLTLVYRMGGAGSDGGKRITRTLKAAAEAWPGDMLAANSDIIGGIGQFYQHIGDDSVDDARLVDRLKQTTPAKLLYSAGLGIGGRHANVAEMVGKMYAKRKR